LEIQAGLEFSVKFVSLFVANFRRRAILKSRSTMSRNIIFYCACFAFLLVSARTSHADDWGSVRKPLGVYAHLDIETAIKRYPGSGTPTATELHCYLRQLYADLLADTAVAGIALGAHWDNIELSDPSLFHGYSDGYDWSYLDDAFDEANAAHKTIQLIITPGFDSPQWLLNKIPPCDPLFTKGKAAADCGTVTFVGYPESTRADGNLLPLPWNDVYKAAWLDFLVHLDAKYQFNPAFISIAIAGPIGASTEIILPTDGNTTDPQPSGLTPDNMWLALIKHSFPTVKSYQNTDQVFIDEWKQVVEGYENIFRGVTLFISPDAGNDLPSFSPDVTPHHDNTLFAEDCMPTQLNVMSCEAKTEILSNFITVDGPNEKATQVGGMTAASSVTLGDIGVPGIKLLTSLWPPPSPPFQGGAEFDLAVSDPMTTQEEGCPDPNGCSTTFTVEESTYNVLTVFFYGTPAAKYYGGKLGRAPMQYVELDYVDIKYAQANPCPTLPTTVPGAPSLQDLLNRASRDLFGMAGEHRPLPQTTCP
jgi:hypothetical protein